MPGNTNQDLVEEIQQRSFDRLMDLAPIIIAAVCGPQGAVGDHPLDRNQRLIRFMQFAQDGTLDMLPQIGRQDLHDELVREYQRDLAAVLGGAA